MEVGAAAADSAKGGGEVGWGEVCRTGPGGGSYRGEKV
jgi:hypothetical protein